MCPIGRQIMRDPTMCEDGYSYERTAITAWLHTHATSPVTHKMLLHRHMMPNHALRNVIEEWCQAWEKQHDRSSMLAKLLAEDPESMLPQLSMLRKVSAPHAGPGVPCPLASSRLQAPGLRFVCPNPEFLPISHAL